jgi:hypothetical protein
LYVWAGFILDSNVWKPISPRPCAPPLCFVSFTSDAAGFKTTFCEEKIGLGCAGFDVTGTICFVLQLFWTPEMFTAIDQKGASFGCKTTTLEMMGLIIPFLCCPHLVGGQHVVLKVDNLGCYYGWENKKVKNDTCASILIRSLILISSFLSCYIHIEHLPRLSSWDAQLCDRVSREKSTLNSDKQLLDSFGNPVAPQVLRDWLKQPAEDWELCNFLLEHVKNL